MIELGLLATVPPDNVLYTGTLSAAGLMLSAAALASVQRPAHSFTMARTADKRPAVALGHVFLRTAEVAAAAAWLAEAGLRPIVAGRGFAVLELRGGTHLVVGRTTRPPRKGTAAPFDLMVDDVDKTHRAYQRKGWKPSPIHRGSIHDSFEVTGPGGCRVSVVSSHAGDRPV
jgi:hypothetical protein